MQFAVRFAIYVVVNELFHTCVLVAFLLDLQFTVLSDMHLVMISVCVSVRYVMRANSRCCLLLCDYHVFVVGFFVLVMVDRHSAGARYLRCLVPRI